MHPTGHSADGEFRVGAAPAQVLSTAGWQRPEGLAFSPAGDLLAVADSATDRVTLHPRRSAALVYDETPCCVLDGAAAGLRYPHDVSFSADGETLAVASREKHSLALFRRRRRSPHLFRRRPVFEIEGPRSRLRYTDGVAFAPDADGLLVAINRKRNSVTLYRRTPGAGPQAFDVAPVQEIRGWLSRVHRPDGLAFSPDGRYLAVTNHKRHGVVVFRRAIGGARFERRPMARLGGPRAALRFPHSVAFSPVGHYLAVSNAGGKSVHLFRPSVAGWEPEPYLRLDATDPILFDEVNSRFPQEGGGKGIAFSSDALAICSAEAGVRIHAVETLSARSPGESPRAHESDRDRRWRWSTSAG